MYILHMYCCHFVYLSILWWVNNVVHHFYQHINPAYNSTIGRGAVDQTGEVTLGQWPSPTSYLEQGTYGQCVCVSLQQLLVVCSDLVGDHSGVHGICIYTLTSAHHTGQIMYTVEPPKSGRPPYNVRAPCQQLYAC